MALQGDEAELKALTTSSISWQTLSSPHSDREIRRDRSFFLFREVNRHVFARRFSQEA